MTKEKGTMLAVGTATSSAPGSGQQPDVLGKLDIVADQDAEP